MEENKRKRASGTRSKKRKFCGNQHTCAGNNDPNVSSSFKKMKSDDILPASENEELKCTFDGYRIFDWNLLKRNIESSLCCRVCQGDVVIKELYHQGLSSKFELKCSKCAFRINFKNSSMVEAHKNVSEINRRFVYAMRTIGQGRAAMEKFSCAMDLPPVTANSTYKATVKRILSATSVAAEKSMQKAAQLEAILSNSSLNVTVSGDGTWKTRGHTSSIGVCSVIGSESGKVIDTEVLSSFCKGCESSSDKDHDCLKNHEGSSGKMEVNGMIKIFSRSEETRGLKYTSYIGDGDTKTYLGICDSKPYGPVKIEKIECVGHVQKRMGTRLRKLKVERKGTMLSDGKPLSGKGRLTEKLINEITSYYGNAIRQHSDSLVNMRKAIWAIYYHKMSTDDHPKHDFCPNEEGTWCKFHKSKGKEFHHKNSVPTAVMKEIKPIFDSLSQPSLLKRCLGGKTQNNNESFNSVIWSYCPKISGSGCRIAQIATNEAVVAFNDGCIGRHSIMNELQLLRSKFSIEGFSKIDKKRIAEAERKCLLETKEQRKLKRQKQVAEAEMAIKKDGNLYIPGGF